MALPNTGLPDNFIEDDTEWSAPTAEMTTQAIDSQLFNLLQLCIANYQDGAVWPEPDGTSFAVSSSGVISPGAAICPNVNSGATGAVLLYRGTSYTVDTNTPGFEASQTGLYLFVVAEYDTNDSRKTGLPFFALSDTSTYNGGVLLASGISTDTDSITAAVDARVFPTADILHQTAETSIASGDYVLIYDVSASAYRKITRGNLVAGLATNPMTTAGDMIVGGASGVPERLPVNATATKKFAQSVSGATTFDVIAAADIPTGVDAAKLADGSVSNTEFQYIGTLTSNAQTQLDAKADKADWGDPVADLTALRAVAPADRTDRQSRYVEAAFDGGATYAFDAEGTGTDDGDLIIQPSTGTGRWKKTGSGTVTVPVDAADVSIETLGTPTYTNLQQLINNLNSAGLVAGGAISESATPDCVDVAAGTGLIRATDVDTDTLMSFDWPGTTALSVPDGTVRYVGIEYNSGTPQAVVRTSDVWDIDTEFPLGSAFNDGGMFCIIYKPWRMADAIGNLLERADSEGTNRDERQGGLILGTTGTRNVTVSAGSLLSRVTEFAISAIDTSGADTYDAYYRNGSGGWTKQASQTQVNNTQYDNGSGTLATLSNNNYVSRWFYLFLDGALAMVYGQTGFNNLSAALLDTPPATVPPRIMACGVLLGRMIYQKSASSPSATESAWLVRYAGTGVTSAADLSNGTTGTGAIVLADAPTLTSSLTMPEMAAPSTPASGNVAVYAKADGHLYIKDDAGTETDLAGGGGVSDPNDFDPDLSQQWLAETGEAVFEDSANLSWSPGSAPDTLQVDLDDTAVTPGSHTNVNATVDAKGRITAMSSGTEVIGIAVSDETSTITTGTAKVTFRMPFAMTLTAVRASVNTVSSSGDPTFDINESGSTILSTKLSIDSGEKTSLTAATPAVISDAAIADDAEITIDIDTAGTGAKGAKIYLIGVRA